MSKIAKQKALEAYPIESHEFHDDFWKERNCYVKGYDQALQDVKEFLYGRFYIHPHDCHVVQYVSEKPLDDIDDLIEEFEKYFEP